MKIGKKIMWGSTKRRIQRQYTVEGYSMGDLLIMYNDYDWRDVRKAVKGLTKAERI